MNRIRIGCAGWTLPRVLQERFPAHGAHLERYAARLDVAEINSSFRQAHRRTTYERWARTVPADFRFSVKLPRSITHAAGLANAHAAVDTFLHDVQGLGDRLGALLVQTPPKLAFDVKVAEPFFAYLRSRHRGGVAAEPRHASWFTAEADGLLRAWDVARVAADPAPHAGAERPGGAATLAYFRWHGSPRIYYSAYDDVRLDALAAQLHRAHEEGRAVWCIFDNTTLGAAVANALELQQRCSELTAARSG